MTPTLADIILGQVAALMAPAPEEAAGDYAAARLGILAMLADFAAQEVERGSAARLWENAALEALFARAAPHYDGDLDGRLARAAEAGDPTPTLSALDARNADLRRLLIALHETVEARGDRPLDRAIFQLYRAMARARRLDLPGAPRADSPGDFPPGAFGASA